MEIDRHFSKNAKLTQKYTKLEEERKIERKKRFARLADVKVGTATEGKKHEQ